MLDSKQSGKKKTRNGQEVEMVQTSDNFLSKPPPATEGDGEAFAQPKGVQTRAAIARHLAAKLKVGDEKMTLQALVQAEQDMQMNQETKDHFWDQNLINERSKICKNREEAE